MAEFLNGQKIVSLNISGGLYTNNLIDVVDDEGNKYKLDVGEFTKILNDLEFSKEKKRVHTYLTLEVA